MRAGVGVVRTYVHCDLEESWLAIVDGARKGGAAIDGREDDQIPRDRFGKALFEQTKFEQTNVRTPAVARYVAVCSLFEFPLFDGSPRGDSIYSMGECQ